MIQFVQQSFFSTNKKRNKSATIQIFVEHDKLLYKLNNLITRFNKQEQ